MAFRDVTTKDLGPKAKKAQKAILEEAAMAVIPPLRAAKLAKAVGKLTGKGAKALRKAAEAKARSYKRRFMTDDGYTFYVLKDGRVVDNLNPKKVDMSWPSTKAYKQDVVDSAGESREALRHFKMPHPKDAGKTVKFKRTKTPKRTTSEAFPGGSGQGAPKGTKGSRETYRDFTNPRPRKKK